MQLIKLSPWYRDFLEYVVVAVHFVVTKPSWFDVALSRFYSVHIYATYFFKIHFNNITILRPLTTSFSGKSLHFRHSLHGAHTNSEQRGDRFVRPSAPMFDIRNLTGFDKTWYCGHSLWTMGKSLILVPTGSIMIPLHDTLTEIHKISPKHFVVQRMCTSHKVSQHLFLKNCWYCDNFWLWSVISVVLLSLRQYVKLCVREKRRWRPIT
jgi:hypothetical protein